MKGFNLNISFDGNFLSVDYCDGSDVETVAVTSRAQLEAAVLDRVHTAMAPEDD